MTGVQTCALPILVTELGVMEITDKGLVLIEIHKDTTVEEVKSLTEAELIISKNLKIMDV